MRGVLVGVLACLVLTGCSTEPTSTDAVPSATPQGVDASVGAQGSPDGSEPDGPSLVAVPRVSQFRREAGAVRALEAAGFTVRVKDRGCSKPEGCGLPLNEVLRTRARGRETRQARTHGHRHRVLGARTVVLLLRASPPQHVLARAGQRTHMPQSARDARPCRCRRPVPPVHAPVDRPQALPFRDSLAPDAINLASSCGTTAPGGHMCVTSRWLWHRYSACSARVHRSANAAQWSRR